MSVTPKSIIDFWLSAGPDKWFLKDQAFDDQISKRYRLMPDQIIKGDFDRWQNNGEGNLALILVLDQFTRNIFRNRPEAFSYDQWARDMADHAIKAQFDQHFEPPLRRFFYLPYMHSESLADQQICIELCQASQDEEGVKYAQLHYDIIERFGRFPHRNEILGRVSSPEEQDYLEQGGFQG